MLKLVVLPPRDAVITVLPFAFVAVVTVASAI